MVLCFFSRSRSAKSYIIQLSNEKKKSTVLVFSNKLFIGLESEKNRTRVKKKARTYNNSHYGCLLLLEKKILVMGVLNLNSR